MRADDDALAARAVDRLEHELVEVVDSTQSQRLRIVQPVRLDVVEERLLAEVVADQLRHVGVDQLVVGDAVADRVGEGDVARRGPR